MGIDFILLFQCWDRLQTSESGVYRRQILTSKVGPRIERVIQRLQRVERLYSSESDVCRRQILTTKVDPRTVRINICLMAVDL